MVIELIDDIFQLLIINYQLSTIKNFQKNGRNKSRRWGQKRW